MGSATSRVDESFNMEPQFPQVEFHSCFASCEDGIAKFPKDLLYSVAMYLNDTETLRFAATCKRIHTLLSADEFWRFKWPHSSMIGDSLCPKLKYWYFTSHSPIQDILPNTCDEDFKYDITMLPTGSESAKAKIVNYMRFTDWAPISRPARYVSNYQMWKYERSLFRVTVWNTDDSLIKLLSFAENTIVLVIYSTSDRSSFNRLQETLPSLRQSGTSRPFLIVVAHSDSTLPVAVPIAEGKEWCWFYHVSFVEVSTETGKGIRQLKKTMLEAAMALNYRTMGLPHQTSLTGGAWNYPIFST